MHFPPGPFLWNAQCVLFMGRSQQTSSGKQTIIFVFKTAKVEFVEFVPGRLSQEKWEETNTLRMLHERVDRKYPVVVFFKEEKKKLVRSRLQNKNESLSEN